MPRSTRSTVYVSKAYSTISSEIKSLTDKKAALLVQEKERQGPLQAACRQIREEYAKKYEAIDLRLGRLQEKLDAEDDQPTTAASTALGNPKGSTRPEHNKGGSKSLTRRQREAFTIADTVWERMAAEKSCDQCIDEGKACYRAVGSKGRLTKWPVYVGGVRYGPCRACKVERRGCVKERAQERKKKVVVAAVDIASGSGKGKQRAIRSPEEEDQERGDNEVMETVQKLLDGAKELRKVVDEQCSGYERILKGIKGN